MDTPEERPSATALMAAFGRAMHAVRDDRPHLLVEPLAWPLLGDAAGWLLELSSRLPEAAFRRYRANWVFRMLETERQLSHAIDGGVTQYVILGAGLDTFAWRHDPLPVRVYEVDQPSVQTWKRARLAALGAKVPGGLAFVPVDLRSDDLLAALRTASFRDDEPTFISWIGVTMYLTREDSLTTLKTLARLAPGSAICMSYSVPEHLRAGRAAEVRAASAAIVAEHGEPWISHYSPEEAEALAREAGFTVVDHVTDKEAAARFEGRTDGLSPDGVERLLVARI